MPRRKLPTILRAPGVTEQDAQDAEALALAALRDAYAQPERASQRTLRQRLKRARRTLPVGDETQTPWASVNPDTYVAVPGGYRVRGKWSAPYSVEPQFWRLADRQRRTDAAMSNAARADVRRERNKTNPPRRRRDNSPTAREAQILKQYADTKPGPSRATHAAKKLGITPGQVRRVLRRFRSD